MKAISQKDRARLFSLVARSSRVGGIAKLRVGGVEIDTAGRDELLAKAVAREYVEVEADLLAYEQGRRNAKGEIVHNRNGVQFRPGSIGKLAHTGVGTPFLRDHDQGNSLAKSGVVTASSAVKLTADGHYQVLQTVKITDPDAVQRALRGLIGAVSIGWNPNTTLTCTICEGPVFADGCRHWPLDVVEVDGQKHTAIWEWGDTELWETSEVPIGGVQDAGASEIRQLAAQLGLIPPETTVFVLSRSAGEDATQRRHAAEQLTNRDDESQESTSMKTLKTAIAAKLGLGETAADDEILSAVDGLAGVRAELKVVTTERDELATTLGAFREREAQHELDDFITAAKNRGALKPAHEDEWRDFYRSNKAGAIARMAKRADFSETPIGQPPQREQPQPEVLAPGATVITPRLRGLNAKLGMSDEKFTAAMKKAQLEASKGGN